MSSDNEQESVEEVLTRLEQDRIDLVWSQITHPTDPMVIVCPYCGLTNLEGQQFCCQALREALNQIMQLGDQA